MMATNWSFIDGKTEERQLLLFRTSSKEGCSAYMNVTIVTRRCPYKLFYGFKDASALDEIFASPPCTLSFYGANFVGCHQNGSDQCNAELAMGCSFSVTCGSKVERNHSQNERFSMQSPWARGYDVAVLSSVSLGRAVANREREFVDVSVLEERVLKRKRQEETRAETRQPRQFSWTWKAFVHLEHPRGQALTAESSAQLSARYGGLSDEAKAFYQEVGDAALSEFKKGRRAFGNRVTPIEKRRKFALRSDHTNYITGPNGTVADAPYHNSQIERAAATKQKEVTASL